MTDSVCVHASPDVRADAVNSPITRDRDDPASFRMFWFGTQKSLCTRVSEAHRARDFPGTPLLVQYSVERRATELAQPVPPAQIERLTGWRRCGNAVPH